MSQTLAILRKTGRNEWCFEFPRITEEVDDLLEEGIDWMLAGRHTQAQERFIEMTKDYPEHIDAYHHLALSIDRTNRRKLALTVWPKGIHEALTLFPKDFDFSTQRLPWGWMQNRPFLRLLHGLGRSLNKNRDLPGAITILERNLSLNPDDDQGVRGDLINCYLTRNLNDDALRLCKKYPNDALENLVYGKPLALFRKGEMKKATRTLSAAIDRFPLIAAELVKERHRRPNTLMEDRVTMGGPDQAWWYWKEAGKLWQGTEGAMEWVKDTLMLNIAIA